MHPVMKRVLSEVRQTSGTGMRAKSSTSDKTHWTEPPPEGLWVLNGSSVGSTKNDSGVTEQREMFGDLHEVVVPSSF